VAGAGAGGFGIVVATWRAGGWVLSEPDQDLKVRTNGSKTRALYAAIAIVAKRSSASSVASKCKADSIWVDIVLLKAGL
jgi:hypothetical protein